VEGDNNQGVKTEQANQSNNLSVQVESSNKLAIAGKRPISSGDLQVVETMNLMGIRPIAAHKMDVVNTINVSGIRPVASSALVVSQTYSVMGNRPVASNNIDDYEQLMGFLD
jgi:hypothetical protein